MSTGKAFCHLHLPRLRALREGRSNDHRVISVKIPPHKVTYTDMIALRDPVFKVNQTLRRKAVDSNRRNVHAWVVGTPVDDISDLHMTNKAVYDPWKGDSFVDAETLEPIYEASYALLVGKDVYYCV